MLDYQTLKLNNFEPEAPVYLMLRLCQQELPYADLQICKGLGVVVQHGPLPGVKLAAFCCELTDPSHLALKVVKIGATSLQLNSSHHRDVKILPGKSGMVYGWNAAPEKRFKGQYHLSQLS